MASTDARLVPLNFLPGFHRESTEYSEEGKWFDGNRVRFREGKPENIRGYEQFSNDDINGFVREAITWTDNESRPYISLGTNRQLYIYQNETQFDATPIVTAVSVSGNFQTFTSGLLVEVSLNNHSVSVTDRVLFEGISTIGNTIDINGATTVVSVSDLNHFFVKSLVTATSAGSNIGSNGSINILLQTEESDAIQGLGYGAGVYNAGVSVAGERAWNSPASASGITFLPTMWSLDTWGEDLLAQRRGGQIYFADIDASATPTRATLVTASPTATTFVVSPNDRHVVCYGAREFAVTVGEGTNPMLVRWSDQEDFNNWTPSATTTSGEVVLAEGTRIIGAIRSRNAINIWTDKALYTQAFVGPPFIFNFTQVGSNCGLIGPHAAIDYDGVSFWMGDNNFYAFDGRVQTLPCTIRRKLFDDFNNTNKEKVYAGINSEFKEIIWLYPLANSSEPNAYVIYNVEERTWVFGKLFADGIVTTFNDRVVYPNTLTTGKVSATADTYIYNNEPEGIYTGEGTALTSFIESGSFDLQEGQDIMFVDRIIPDYKFTPGEEVSITLQLKEYPSSQAKVKGPFTISQNTTKVDLRARARQATIKVSATNTGSWRWGKVRMSMQPDGQR
jgi:hypothetical protein